MTASRRCFPILYPGPAARRALAALSLAVVAWSALAQDSAALAERYPAGSIATPEQAAQALEEVGREQARVRARFEREEQACYGKFFATSCRDKAKEERRLSENRLRAIEVEAQAFQRRYRAEERDRALAARRAEEEAEAPERLERQREREAAAARKAADRERRAEEDRAQEAQAAERAQHDRRDLEKEAGARKAKAPAPRAAGVDPRVERHEEKRREAEAREARDAAKRMENIADYERKQKAAAERQRKLEERRARKEAERAAKEAQSGAQ